MSKETNTEKMSVENIIATAIQIPGVKVNRENFLLNTFKTETPAMRNKILEVGPAKAGIGRRKLKRIAKLTVNSRTITSTTASFVAGLPGGLVMAATIPADTLQFFGVSLRLAQEISYLYGEDDLWIEGKVNMEKVTNHLIAYCGVMFGVSGASSVVRVVSSAFGRQVLKKVPQMALTKTFYYPIVKAVAKSIGVKMTKGIFAKGVSKVVPVVGGIVSGALTFVSMRPMGNRLVEDFDEIVFDYSKGDFEQDWRDISVNYDIGNIGGQTQGQNNMDSKSWSEKLREAKALLDEGVITQLEYDQIKEKFIMNL